MNFEEAKQQLELSKTGADVIQEIKVEQIKIEEHWREVTQSLLSKMQERDFLINELKIKIDFLRKENQLLNSKVKSLKDTLEER